MVEGVKQGLLYNVILVLSYKINCKNLVSSYYFSHFVPIFKKIDKKLARYNESSFYVIRNYTRHLPQF